MRRHVAILGPELVEAILAGTKRVESRLSRNRVVPFGMISVGDEVYLRARGEPVSARALVERVLSLEGLTPARVRSLAREHNHHILGPREYWLAKAKARYASLIWLADVTPMVGPRGRIALPDYAAEPNYRPRAGWHVMSDANAPAELSPPRKRRPHIIRAA